MSGKFALIIANMQYADPDLAQLSAPGNDAEELAQVLQNPDLAAFDSVQVLLNEAESTIRRSVARFFANRKRSDLLLFYFSGHGVRGEQGKLFLAAHDTEISILEATGIAAEFVTQAMNESRSQRQVLILDCCNSGAFAQGGKSASGVGQSMGIGTAFEGSGFGRVVLTATDATQFAWEGDKIIGSTQQSVFTHFLILGLRGAADLDGDGRITVDELYDYAYDEVVRQTPKQTPGKWSYKQQGEILLRENVSIRQVNPVPLPPDLLEVLTHSSSFVRSSGVQELIRLLDGKNLGLARSAQDKLNEIAVSDDSLTLRKTASEALIARGLALDASAFQELSQRPLAQDIQAVASSPPGGRDDAKHEQGRDTARPAADESSRGKWRDMRALAIGGIVMAGLGLAWVSGAYLVRHWPGSPSQSSNGTAPGNLPTPGVGSNSTSSRDGMTLLYVPAGKFTMGSDAQYPDEQPSHIVSLDAFWIDRTEVTNGMYAQCVKAGVCDKPASVSSNTRPQYYGSTDFDHYPVIFVSWQSAETYCKWAGRRLPSEAEWEKAARGTDGRTYPWGNAPLSNNLLNYNYLDGQGDTTEVGRYPSGASPYGALDMAGNVWEWVNDWYSGDYYAHSPSSNPVGPVSGSERILRGGPWSGDLETDVLRSSYRYNVSPNYFGLTTGFRCARSAPLQ